MLVNILIISGVLLIWLAGVLRFYRPYKKEIEASRFRLQHSPLEYALLWPAVEFFRLVMRISDNEL